MDENDDIPANKDHASRPNISELIEIRLSRRGLLSGAAAAGGLAAAGWTTSLVAEPGQFNFPEITRGIDEYHHVPEGYEAEVLIRWGDPLFADSPSFEPAKQTRASQERQFGFNNDYVGYWPLEPGQGQDERGILCVNHEYTLSSLMFPGVGGESVPRLSRELTEVEIAAHGGSVVEIARQGGQWQVIQDSPLNRRITGFTPMSVSGPAAGDARMKTADDPTGRRVLGTLNNCAGGITPWGTYLMAEENFNGYFSGFLREDHPNARSFARYSLPSAWYAWADHFPRFDVSQEPNEANRFGWVVEVDIHDPESTPIKRTALGRFKHEGAESVLAPDGRVVVYMGDDQQFDYVYKYVSTKAYDAANPDSAQGLLDDGTLYVARFNADGSLDWLPLVHGNGPLTAEHGFNSQADVLIDTRLAADHLGATPMDRPEDVEPDPTSGSVWVMLTNNHLRVAGDENAANPRALNFFGHIVEIKEPGGDFAATRSRWDFLVKCGDPNKPEFGAMWNPNTSGEGWFGAPDNCAVDPSGRLWVATDGNPYTGANDGIWAMDTLGGARGTGRAFFRAPAGAEVCGPRFTPGGDTLFLSVQHPADTEESTFDAPAHRWPDFDDSLPPRPAVLAIRKKGGGPVGS